MKAIILAAGKGERIKEISKFTPKPMFLYKGKPIIQYNIELCKKYGITDIYVNTHHHSNQIQEYLGKGEKLDVKITYSFEEDLLGTSGALLNFKNFLQDAPFFVIYSDQICDFDLNELIKKYNDNNGIGVIAFHYREDIIHSGVAEFDSNMKIIRFIEKPKPDETDSHWVNAGIYYLNPAIFDFVPAGTSDFGKDIFPELLKKQQNLFGVCKNKEVKVFDTLEMYNKTISLES